jgi:hypothetical protein
MNSMNDLKTVTDVVRITLEQYKATRDCDGLLYLKVLEHFATEKGEDLRLLSVPIFLTQMKEKGYPPFESVRRTRQKLQQRYPELAASEIVQEFRAEEEKKYRAFAGSDV